MRGVTSVKTLLEASGEATLHCGAGLRSPRLCFFFRPDGGLLGPLALRELLIEPAGGVGQSAGVFRCFVTGHSLPVDGLGRCCRLREAIDDPAVPLLGVLPLLLLKSGVSQTELELREKIVHRKETFETITFLSFGLEQQQGWGPEHVKPAKSARLLFNVDFHRNEVFGDELLDAVIRINLGFQPSAAASLRGRTEIQ